MALRLNLGCGTNIMEGNGWVNLDIVKKWPLSTRACDVLWDARTDKIPFADGTVDEIYSGYLLMHLAPTFHPGVLNEMKRVLRPSGRLVVGEVDMEVVMARFLKDPLNHSCHQLIWGEQGELHGENLADFDKHCHGFTHASLVKTLTDYGFADMQRIQIHSSEVFYELTVACVRP